MKFSIITINFNNSIGLKKTLQSVVQQTYRGFEYIIIDGGSTDGSIDVIKEHNNHISYKISENDNGVYHAMNKGIQRAKGEYLLFLNSGDTLRCRNVLSLVAECCSSEDIVYGDLEVIDGHEQRIKTYPDFLTFDYFLRDTLPHPATFIKRILFEKYGMYNENNKIVSDWQFFITVINKFNCSYKHLQEPLSVFNLEGISSRAENILLIKKEKQDVLNDLFPTFLENYKELASLRSENRNLNNSRVLQLANKFKGLLNRVSLV